MIDRVFDSLQGLGVRLVFGFFRILPLDMASALGGWIARTIGPRLGTSRRARQRLLRALPDLDAPTADRAILRMWDNLGRVVAEYPHLTRMSVFEPGARIEVIGTEHVDAARAARKPILFVSGHFGNWEIAAIAATRYGLDILQVYRAADTQSVEAVMHDLRRSLGVEPVAKGASGARRIVAALKAGRSVMMLIDQKMNDGISVPFFGREAMTVSAPAVMALRYGAVLIPGRIDRLTGARFRLTLYPPIEVTATGDPQADQRAIMTRANAILEGWIREDPGAWFWLHRRWPEDGKR